jgi:hypothetical protein
MTAMLVIKSHVSTYELSPTIIAKANPNPNPNPYLLTYLLTVRQWTPAMCHHHPGAQTENRQNATQYICAE